MAATGRMHRVIAASLAVVFASLAACRDGSVAPKQVILPVDQMANLGTYIVDVDMKANTVKVHPLGESIRAPKGVNAAFYGKGSEIEHVLTILPTTPIGSIGSGIAEYHLREHINNLLAFAIGTNQPHVYPALPQDTMGVYIYLSFPPYSLAGLSCPNACSVTVDSVDGGHKFVDTSPQPQSYWYFKTILQPGTHGVYSGQGYSGTAGGFDYSKIFNFTTTGSITSFSFGISVSAAWVPPNDVRWPVFYTADSLPNRLSFADLRSEPDWRLLGTSAGTATLLPSGCSPGNCSLNLVNSSPGVSGKDTLMYFRSDSLGTSQNSYINATVSTSGQGTAIQPSVFLGLQDRGKLIQLGIAPGLAGFTDGTGAFVVGTTFIIDNTQTSWRVAKFGTDSAVIYSPAASTTSLKNVAYSTLPVPPVKIVYDRYFFFGNITTATLAPSATSVWKDVNYEVGAFKP